MRDNWIRRVQIDSIDPNPHQPRRRFAEDELAELSDSIKKHGVLQPITIQPGSQMGRYTLVSGERRLKAAKLAGLNTIPGIISDPTDQFGQLTLALVENIQREDLDDIELARAYLQLKSEFNRTQDEISGAVGKSRSHISNTMRLLELSEPTQNAITEGRISAGHARALLMVPAVSRSRLFARILKKGLNVRQTEDIARGIAGDGKKKNASKTAPAEDPAVTGVIGEMQSALESSLKRKVKITRNTKGSGRITIDFYSDNDLESLYGYLKGDH